MKKQAFTMIELVFVIVVLGILTALAIPRLERDHKQEAADNILSAIRYTQHLALLDNKQKFDDPKWQRQFWAIHFTSSEDYPLNNFYTVSSDSDMSGDLSLGECAIDPANGKYMYNAGGATTAIDSNESPNIFIGDKYGIKGISTSGGCSGSKHIGFDHLGRYHVGFSSSGKPNYSSYKNTECIFTFTMTDNDTFSISIQPETGYAQIVGQENS